MKYLNRELKGNYLYIKKQFIFELIVTIVLFAMAFGLYLIGLITLKTNKSLWSVIAVLAMLPACKSLVGVIMFARFRSLSEDVYLKYTNVAGKIPCLYENVITTSKKSYYLPIIACRNNNIVAYCNVKKSDDIKTLTEHFELVLKNGGHKVATIKIYDKEEAFLKRLSEMNSISSDDKLYSAEAIFNTIKAVSL